MAESKGSKSSKQVDEDVVDSKPKGNPAKGPAQEPGRQIVWKGQREFRHDLYKLKVAAFLKNTSYQSGIVKAVEVDHCHFFHSHNSQGKAQTITNAVGGHYHEITQDKDGNMVCGPALREVFKKRAGRQRKYVEPVKWLDEEKDRFVEDTHIHEVEYQHSEVISEAKVRGTRSENHAQTQMMQMQAQAAQLGMKES